MIARFLRGDQVARCSGSTLVFQRDADRLHIGFPDPGDFRQIEPFNQIIGRVVIRNQSKYSGRNPGVLIELEGCGLIDPDLSEWRQISFGSTIGITVIQWDVGADYIIHGKWLRTLPPLNFQGLTAYRDDPQLVVSAAADGFGPRKWEIPVLILGPGIMKNT